MKLYTLLINNCAVSLRYAAWLISLWLMTFSVMAGVVDTRHNLSVSGPGGIRASSEDQVCIFCHTPHNSEPNSPLWNRASPGSNYVPYSSSTALASPGQPTGSSILCLSCHDGTIALGQVLSRPAPISMIGGITTMPTGAARLGTDLSDDHPISFNYTTTLASQRGELVNPGSLTGAVKLDKAGQMQCTSCHDPHNNSNGKFLVMQNSASALCRTCHVKNKWNETDHSTSSNTWNGVAPDPWTTTSATTVAGNACENCHTPHNAGGNQRILKYAAEEDNCYVCHNGHVDSKDVQGEFSKFSRHPIMDTQGVHDPGEQAVVNTRHVECQDCHNPHAANSGNPLNGVSGIGILGNNVAQVSGSHELCFRCHGDSQNKPAALTPRQIDQTNVRLEFNTNNPSFHPVAGSGKNPNVPSLIAPLSTSSQITCLDCHNNNANPSVGSGPNGPHGSSYAPLLERRYVTTDNTSESASNYALCYKCHSRSSILGDQSFTLHDKHIRGERAPCNVCHDPHGVSATQGNSTNNSHLINFDTSVVSPNMMGGGGGGGPTFTDNGTFAGSCTLSCHGRNHMNFSYPGGMGGGGGGGGGGGM